MKCERCKTEVELKRYNINKKIVIKKGTKIDFKRKALVIRKIRLFRKDILMYDSCVKTMRAKKDLEEVSFICPVCDLINVLSVPNKPYFLLDAKTIYYNEDEWDMVNTTHKKVEEIDN